MWSIMHLHVLLLATRFALVLTQDESFLTVLPPPPQSSELDRHTTETQDEVSSFTSVVSYPTSVINFLSTARDGKVSVVTIITQPPGPPRITVVRTTRQITRTKTVDGPAASTTLASSSSSSNDTPSSSPSTEIQTLTTTTSSSSSFTPGVSTSPTSTTDPPAQAKKGIGATAIGVIVIGILAILAFIGSAAYLMKKRRTRERIDERSAAYRNRSWNSARPVISSPLNTANLAELNGTVARLRSDAPSNMQPSRPARPTSLSESIQESMRMTSVAGMRKVSGSMKSGVMEPMMSGGRMSPDPLNIVKKGAAARDRSATNSSTTPHFGDPHTRNASGIEPSQLEQLRELERELEEQVQSGKAPENLTYVHVEPPPPAELPGNSAGTTGHGHPSPPPALPYRPYAVPHGTRFADPDEEDKTIRAARRASTQRKLDGESIRSKSTSPPMFDSATARAERQKLIAQKQRLIAEQQKKIVGKEKNITDFGPGPMPAYAPPPPPGPPPPGYF